MAELGRCLSFPHHSVVDVCRLLDDFDRDRPSHLEVVG
jgi:hypothetical protein